VDVGDPLAFWLRYDYDTSLLGGALLVPVLLAVVLQGCSVSRSVSTAASALRHVRRGVHGRIHAGFVGVVLTAALCRNPACPARFRCWRWVSACSARSRSGRRGG